MSTQVTLCLLTWNEIRGCKEDVPKIPNIFDRIIAIDNSSTDGTVDYLLGQGIEVFKQVTSSYNGAYIDAIKQSGDSAVIFFHPKGTIDVSTLSIAHQEMKTGVDFLLASRMMKESSNEEDDRFLKPRKWFVFMVAVACKVKWGTRRRFYLDDPLHGYRGLSPKFMKSLNLISRASTADIEMVRHAYRDDFSIKKFPVREFKRPWGDTHFPAFSTGRKILKYLFHT